MRLDACYTKEIAASAIFGRTQNHPSVPEMPNTGGTNEKCKTVVTSVLYDVLGGASTMLCKRQDRTSAERAEPKLQPS